MLVKVYIISASQNMLNSLSFCNHVTGILHTSFHLSVATTYTVAIVNSCLQVRRTRKQPQRA